MNGIQHDMHEIVVPDDTLLIDLGNKKGELSLIKLYDRATLFTKDQKPDLKLSSYHISYTE